MGGLSVALVPGLSEDSCFLSTFGWDQGYSTTFMTFLSPLSPTSWPFPFFQEVPSHVTPIPLPSLSGLIMISSNNDVNGKSLLKLMEWKVLFCKFCLILLEGMLLLFNSRSGIKKEGLLTLYICLMWPFQHIMQLCVCMCIPFSKMGRLIFQV